MIKRINKANSKCLIFFNPVCTDRTFWESAIPAEILEAYEIILIDYPGYNSDFKKVESYQELAEYYHDELLSKIEKPMHLIGYSYGGILVQHLLNNKYNNLKSAVLVGCSNELKYRDKELLSVLKEILKSDMLLFCRAMSLLTQGVDSMNTRPLMAIQQYSHLKMSIADKAVIQQQIDHMLKLKQVNVRRQSTPVLFVYGDNDRLIDKDLLPAYKKSFASLRVVNLKGEDHMIDLEKVFTSIGQFLKLNYDSQTTA